MSKKRHKSNGNQSRNQGNPVGGLNPQMLEMLGLGNLDMNKVSELLNSMGNDGFDMNSINAILNNKDMNNNKENNSKSSDNKYDDKMGNNNPLASMLGVNNQMGDLGALVNLLSGGAGGGNGMNSSMMNGMGNGDLASFSKMFGGLGGEQSARNSINNENNMDPIVIMLVSLKNIVDPQRARFLDKVLRMYKEGKITY